MGLFSYLYNKTISWSKHPKSNEILALVSFSESSFFPVPPDVMLIPMGLSRPERAWHYAFIATFFSLLGGILGYFIGMFGMEFFQHYLALMHLENRYHEVVNWFQRYGVWVVFVAGFSPIPYKVFTIAAGALQLGFLPFLLASLLGRGLRFYLVSGILYFYGDKLHENIYKYIDKIAWSLLIIFAILFIIYKYLS